MAKKLSTFGSGPLIFLWVLPYLLAAGWIDRLYPALFSVNAIPFDAARYGALILAAAGAFFYSMTIRRLLRGLRETRLITDGPYGWSRNPLYAAFFVFFIPAIALAMRSWLVLTTCVVFYGAFRVTIGREEKEMTEHFGDEYRRYCARTSLLFPLPPKK
ncbi:MAG TPA: isoprenylcysteine carboxylmethyltransferase family protein [bacterium]|nr:isoprenylcysteine carboxylmethyltransferase family protein [bacterium]